MLKCACHLPKRIFYNTRSIISYPKFKEHYFLLFMILYKFLVPFCCPVPSLIFNKCLIRSEIHTHRLTAARAIWNQTRRNRKLYFSVFRFLQFPVFYLKSLTQHHFFNLVFIVIGFLMARLTTLKQPIIALCIKYSVFIKAGLLETMIHICCQNKIILLFHQIIQVLIYWSGSIHITVDIDIPAPVSPVLFQCFIWVEASCIHIGKSIFLSEIRKIFFKSFTVIHKAG